ncbi:LOW QUALITY PROTEIN: coiled-coil domain containing 88A [Aplochiton taeniatus]
MDSNIMEIIEGFVESALVQWVQLFESVVDGEDSIPLYSQYMEVNSNSQKSQDRYLRLTNGIFLNEVMRVIDPNLKVEPLYHGDKEDQMLRVQNFSILNRHLRAYYQEDLQQLILMPLPNIAILGQDPFTETAVEELRRLLLLLLGCAVQCERKELFIQQIQSLDFETQAAIASCIQEVTQDPRTVLPLHWEELGRLEAAELRGLFGSMAKQIQGLLAQRDAQLERIAELCRERESHVDSDGTALPGGQSEELPQGLTVQLADSRAKLRRLKQELEDKGDQLLDYKQEVQTMEVQLKKLQKENRGLQGEVRGMRALRDELDCQRERAGRAEQLQAELQGAKHKLRSLEFTRTQLKEQQQLCLALQETRALLEEQLRDARARCSLLRELERDNLLLRQRLVDLEGERDTERQRVDELLEMKISMEADLWHHSNTSAKITVMQGQFNQLVESDEEFSEMIDTSPYIPDLKPLSVEVGEASTLRLLGAEQENAELRRRLEDLKAEQEADGPDMKAELVHLEAEHQNTVREFQNAKNENVTLRKRLEELMAQLRRQDKEEEEEERGMTKGGEEQRGERGVQGSGSSRGERGVQGSEPSRGERGVQGSEPSREERGVQGSEPSREERGVQGSEPSREERGVQDSGPSRGERGVQGSEPSREERGVQGSEPSREERGVQGSGPSRGERGVQGSDGSKGKGEEGKEETDEGEEEAYVDRHPTEGVQSGADLELLASRLQEAQEEADRQASVAQDLRSKLGEQSKKAWEAEQRLVLLEAEGQRLRKAAESLGEARRCIEVLQSEGLAMEEELCRLRSQAELQRMQEAVIATLEGERAALERDRDALRSTVDALRSAHRKSDQLELNAQALKAELERQGRSLDSSRHREEELEAELREATLEAESSARGRDQALLEAARWEQEKEACQSELDGQRKEQRQKEREVARLRQQLQSTASALEHSNQRARGLEAEHRNVSQELSQSRELCAQLQDLEKELGIRLEGLEKHNQELKEQNTDSQTKIPSLTKELSNEKLNAQKLSNEVTHLNQELARKEAELRTATDSLHQSQKKTQSLLQSQEETEALLQSQERKSSSNLDVSLSECLTQTSPAAHTPSHPQGSPSIDQQDAGQRHDLSMTSDIRAERDRALSERLIDLERENAVVSAEREVLLSQLSQARSACDHLREQVDVLQRHSISLQDTCTKLQTINTQLQVEQASLSSQHAVVLARCSEGEARCAALEAESKVWARERDESLARTEALRRDQERMAALQQRQEAELEEMMEKHSQLRSTNRSLETQHRELEERYQKLLDTRVQLEEREREMRAEKEKMEGEAQRQVERERELERVKEENERLQALQREWVLAQTELLAQGSMLRGELSSAQLERMRLEGELSAMRETTQSLDLSNVRLSSQYQLLTQLKGNMEEENRHLVEHNQSLLKENRTLMEQSLERKDQHHNLQRESEEKLSELRREKQKLVEKIMDQYRVLDIGLPTPSKAKKSNWIADRMKKLIKPRGWEEEEGGGGREGRALYYAAGSVENLADSTDNPADTAGPDPRSAPVSPSPLRRPASRSDPDPPSPSGPGGLAQRPGSGGRRKLGSRHGWGLGVARASSGAGGVSQSFSPGDRRPPPRLAALSSQVSSSALWEMETSETSAPERERDTAMPDDEGEGLAIKLQWRCSSKEPRVSKSLTATARSQ